LQSQSKVLPLPLFGHILAKTILLKGSTSFLEIDDFSCGDLAVCNFVISRRGLEMGLRSRLTQVSLTNGPTEAAAGHEVLVVRRINNFDLHSSDLLPFAVSSAVSVLRLRRRREQSQSIATKRATLEQSPNVSEPISNRSAIVPGPNSRFRVRSAGSTR
jgi:hypothetical protein